MRAKQLAVSLTAAAVMGAFGSAFAQTSTDNNVNVSPSVGGSSTSDTTASPSTPSADCTCPEQTNVQSQAGSTSGGDSANAPDASCSCPGDNASSGSSAAGGSSASSSSSMDSGAAAGAGDDPESQSAQDKASTQTR